MLAISVDRTLGMSGQEANVRVGGMEMGISTSPSVLLSIFAAFMERHPHLWELIHPHVPAFEGQRRRTALSHDDAFLVGAASMTREVARIAIEAQFRGESSAGLVEEWVDDWCATPWPHRWPRPPGPRPDSSLISEARFVGALVLASAGTHLGKSELRDALLKGADDLCEAALATPHLFTTIEEAN